MKNSGINSAFVVKVGSLLNRHVEEIVVESRGFLSEIENSICKVRDDTPIIFNFTLENGANGVVVRGKIVSTWEGTCRRCLTRLKGNIEAQIGEIYVPDPDIETEYLLENENVDLSFAIRDALILELPLAPLCKIDCLGLCSVCGADRNESPCQCYESQGRDEFSALKILLDHSDTESEKAN